jgi:hypothetical protein
MSQFDNEVFSKSPWKCFLIDLLQELETSSYLSSSRKPLCRWKTQTRNFFRLCLTVLLAEPAVHELIRFDPAVEVVWRAF